MTRFIGVLVATGGVAMAAGPAIASPDGLVRVGALVLVAEGLSKRFGSLVALAEVGLEVGRGQIVGLLGPNGAGKTTTMRAVMGLIALDEGAVTWDGRPVDHVTRARFGYMPAERGMYQRMKVRDHLVYYARLSGMDAGRAGRASDDWLERIGLTDRAADTVQSLSSGNQQRVQLALALLAEPDLLVLDEPFSGLDPLAAETLGEVLRQEVERGAALLLSSHQLDLVADVSDAVVIVDRGRVVLQGDVTALRAASDTRYLDVEFVEPTAWPADAAPDRRRRLAVGDEAEAARLLAEARAAGAVLAHAYAPPGLSEVFLRAVGRDAAEVPLGAGGAGG